MTKLLTFKEVFVQGRNEYRLKGVNFSISDGEKIALLGQSGAGKSTIIEVANGTLQPNTGEVRWRGIQVNQLSQRQRSRIATLWQDLRLIEELTVSQNINIGALGRHNLLWAFWNLFGTIESEPCLACLDAAGLEQKYLTTPIRKLSGGQLQRVAIARLIRQQAELLLADEPLSSLDPALMDEMLLLLLNKKRMQLITIPKTCLISLHRPDLISHFTRVIGLKNGRIVVDCPTKNIALSEINSLYIDE